MRVALCLSGFPRTMEYSYPYLKKYIIDELSPDIFFFGYEDPRNNKEQIQNLYKASSCVARKYTPEVEKEIWDSYGTKTVENVQMHGTRKPITLLSQYYNIFKSNELKSLREAEGGFTYDLTIRCRTEYYFFRKINDEDFSVEPGHVYIPPIWDFGGVTDGFAYGDSEAMDIYSNVFYRMSEYNLVDKVRLHPETIMGHHVNKHLTRVPIKNHMWWELVDFAKNPDGDCLKNNWKDVTDSYIEGLTNNPHRHAKDYYED